MTKQPMNQNAGEHNIRVIPIDPAAAHLTRNLLYGKAFTTAGSIARRLQSRSAQREPLTLEPDLSLILADRISEPYGKSGFRLEYAHQNSLRAAERELFKNAAATRWLEEEGFSLHTARRFHLGLKTGGEYTRALVFPLLDAAGKARTRRIYQDLPKITRHTGPWKGIWTLGIPTTYWVTPLLQQRTVIICNRFDLGWRFAQLIEGTPLADRVCLIVSSDPDTVPEEWTSKKFWAIWDEIYFACDSETQLILIAEARASMGSRTLHLLLPPTGQTWRGFTAFGGTETLLRGHMEQAGAFIPKASTDDDERPSGTLLDVNMKFTGGALYYPFYRCGFPPPITPLNESGPPIPTIERCVLRSDGIVLKVLLLPPRPLPGGPTLILDDGSLIEDLPVPAASALTFNQEAIKAFQAARLTGRSALSRTGAELLAALQQHLASTAPDLRGDGHLILAYALLLSYVQGVFHFLPLFCLSLTDPQDRLASALHALGCNSVLLPVQVGDAVVASSVHASGGLLILQGDVQPRDATGTSAVDDLYRLLKRACSRETAVHPILDLVSGSPRLLSTRAVTVLFRPSGSGLPSGAEKESLLLEGAGTNEGSTEICGAPLPPAELFRLRQDLHIWGMEQAALLSTTDINRMYPNLDIDERARALLTVATIVEDERATATLLSYLKLQSLITSHHRKA
ncbi:hypothetical protein [Deinococcus altitudinis]|uniref:hypothetical protein n=1 Tax=Deinococcus altitudinis TaxID=468914 RepID=UPI0038924D4A